MCNEDSISDVFIDEWDVSCKEANVWIGNGLVPFECESTNVEFARRQCCENYIVEECNVIKKVFFFFVT